MIWLRCWIFQECTQNLPKFGRQFWQHAIVNIAAHCQWLLALQIHYVSTLLYWHVWNFQHLVLAVQLSQPIIPILSCYYISNSIWPPALTDNKSQTYSFHMFWCVILTSAYFNWLLLRNQKTLGFAWGRRLDARNSCNFPPRNQGVDFISSLVGINWLHIAKGLQNIHNQMIKKNWQYPREYTLTVTISCNWKNVLLCPQRYLLHESCNPWNFCIGTANPTYQWHADLPSNILFIHSQLNECKQTLATRKSESTPFPPRSSLPRATISRARSVFQACKKAKINHYWISKDKIYTAVLQAIHTTYRAGWREWFLQQKRTLHL